MSNHQEKILKAKQFTVAKRKPLADHRDLPHSQKFELQENDTLRIFPSVDEVDGHYEIELKEPKKGFSRWYVWKNHVEILS